MRAAASFLLLLTACQPEPRRFDAMTVLMHGGGFAALYRVTDAGQLESLSSREDWVPRHMYPTGSFLEGTRAAVAVVPYSHEPGTPAVIELDGTSISLPPSDRVTLALHRSGLLVSGVDGTFRLVDGQRVDAGPPVDHLYGRRGEVRGISWRPSGLLWTRHDSDAVTLLRTISAQAFMDGTEDQVLLKTASGIRRSALDGGDDDFEGERGCLWGSLVVTSGSPRRTLTLHRPDGSSLTRELPSLVETFLCGCGSSQYFLAYSETTQRGFAVDVELNAIEFDARRLLSSTPGYFVLSSCEATQ